MDRQTVKEKIKSKLKITIPYKGGKFSFGFIEHQFQPGSGQKKTKFFGFIFKKRF